MGAEAVPRAESFRCCGAKKYSIAGTVMILKGYSIQAKIIVDGKELYNGVVRYSAIANT